MPRSALWWTVWGSGLLRGIRAAGKEGGEIKALEDRLASVVLLILSCLVMIESVRLKLDSVHNPGPGFMPFFLGLSLAILSILSLVFPDRRKKGMAFWSNWQRGQSTFYVFVGFIVYLLLFRILGFYIDTFLLMVYLLKVSGETGYKRPLLVSLLTMVVTYLLFYKLLFIPFTRGLLGI
jgi:putative tricarboxylic transport membrane protein